MDSTVHHPHLGKVERTVVVTPCNPDSKLKRKRFPDYILNEDDGDSSRYDLKGPVDSDQKQAILTPGSTTYQPGIQALANIVVDRHFGWEAIRLGEKTAQVYDRQAIKPKPPGCPPVWAEVRSSQELEVMKL